MSLHSHEDQDRIRDLVNDYETMICSGNVHFLDSADFECIIDYYDQKSRLDEALHACDCALEQHAYTTLFYIEKARLLIDSNKTREAIACLEKAESIDANQVRIFILKAAAHQADGNQDLAFIAIERAELISTEEDHFDIHFAKAFYYEETENYKIAFRELTKAIFMRPYDKEALSRIWFIVEVADLYQESADFHERLIDSAPYSSLAWYNLGHAFYNLLRYDDAAESFEYAYVIDQEFKYAYCDHAEALIQLELYEKAIECFEKASEHLSIDAFMQTRMGFCFEQLDNIADAELCYYEAIRLDASYDDAYYRLGECYFKRKKWAGAKGAYESAFCLDNKNATYLVALAETHYQLENYNTAFDFFQQACDMAPDECKNWIRLAGFHASMKDYNTAIEVLVEAEMYNSGTIMLDYCRVACLYQAGRCKESLALLQMTLYEDENQAYELLFDFAPELKYVNSFVDAINLHNDELTS